MSEIPFHALHQDHLPEYGMEENSFYTSSFYSEAIKTQVPLTVETVEMEDEEIEEEMVLEEEKTYMTLQPPIKKEKHLPSEEDTGYDPGSWMRMHPDNWTPREVLDWLFCYAEKNNVHLGSFRAEAFNDITGMQLSRMSQRDFMHLEPTHGSCLYNRFQVIKNKAMFSAPNLSEDPNLQGTAVDYLGHDSYNQNPVDLFDLHFTLSSSTENSLVVNIAGKGYDIDTRYNFFDDIDVTTASDEGYLSADSEKRRCSSSSSSLSSLSDVNDVPPRPTTIVKQVRKPGRPRKIICSESDSAYDKPQDLSMSKATRGRRPGQPTKGNHLWEFVRDLLKNEKYNPSLVKWEDKEMGVFRFVQSERVAQLWGKKKNNDKMNYEKLSRAMRFCRSAKYFSGLPKEGRFPKKLCFRFGEKAHDWN